MTARVSKVSRHPRFVDDRHALYVGWILGFAVKHGLGFEPVVVDGDYTDRLRMVAPDGCTVIEVVVPYPPDDWSLTSE